MTFEQYQIEIWNWIGPLPNADDVPHIELSMKALYDAGWTYQEARRYLMCTEEVNPDLDEKTALARMDVILEGVSKRLGLTK